MSPHELHPTVEASLADLHAKADGIIRRLDTLNGTVARHEKEFRDKDILDAQLVKDLGTLLGDYNDRKAEAKKRKEMWVERVLWFALSLGLLFAGYLINH